MKLCKEDADLIIRYQNEVKSQIEQFNKELLDTQKTFFDKLNGIIAANNKIIEKTVEDGFNKVKKYIKQEQGVCFSYKAFLTWATISITCMCFTGMYAGTWVYLNWILAFWNRIVVLF